MNIINVNVIYKIILSLYFGYGIWMYYKNSKNDFVLLYNILRGKTELDLKFNFNNLKTKSTLGFCFLFMYFISFTSIISDYEDGYLFKYIGYFNFFFFISGIILMSLFLYYSNIKDKINYYKSILNPIFYSDIIDESIQNQHDTKIHDNIDVNSGIQEDNQSLNVQGTGRNLTKKPKQEGIQVNISSGKENGRVTSQILRKSSDVVPDDITDKIIQEKMDLLKESYSLYCDIHDFASVLKKKEINKKILFVNKDHETVDFTKPEYLKLLNIIVDGNIGSHPNNTKVKEWIYFSFDNSNIREKKIGTEDISKLKNDLKKNNLK